MRIRNKLKYSWKLYLLKSLHNYLSSVHGLFSEHQIFNSDEISAAIIKMFVFLEFLVQESVDGDYCLWFLHGLGVHQLQVSDGVIPQIQFAVYSIDSQNSLENISVHQLVVTHRDVLMINTGDFSPLLLNGIEDDFLQSGFLIIAAFVWSSN